jgi:hypothetical protein
MMTKKFRLRFSLLLILIPILGNQASAQVESSRIIFAVIEGSKVNLYSVNLDGSDRKLLLTDELEATNLTADQAIRASISPLGKAIAYALPRNGSPYPLFLMDTDGKNRRKIVDKIGYHFYWSPSGRKILYPRPAPNGPEEFTLVAWGSEWHLLDLQTQRDEIIARGHDDFYRLWLWLRDDRILFGGERLFREWISWKTLQNGGGRKMQLASPDERRHYNREITASPNKLRTLIAFYSATSIDESCDVFQLLPNGRLGKRFVNAPGYRCTPEIKWNGDNEFYYTRGVGPMGRVRIGERNKFGYYVLPSIYRYSLRSRKDEVVLKTDGRNMYMLEDIITNEAMIVTAIDPARESRYALELRRLDGSQRITLFTSNKKISYIGSVDGR